MAKNVLSLQLLRNSAVYPNKADAIAGITGSTTQDGVIKLARYTEGTATKTIFGIYNDGNSGRTAGYTIYDSYKEAIDAMQDQINAISGASVSGITAVEARLGDGVTSGNTATQQLQALSGTPGASSADTSVEGAKSYTNDKVAEEIGKLDNTSDAAVAGQYITYITESDGIVSVGARADIAGAVLNGYQKGSDSGDVASTDTINQALSKLEKHIEVVSANTSSVLEGLDYSGVTTGTGVYVTNVTETDGVISATTATLPTVSQIGTAGQAITAVSQTNGEIAATAGDVAAEHVTVADADNNFTASTVEGVLAEIKSGYTGADATLKSEIVGDATTDGDTLGKLEDRIEALDADAKEYSLSAITDSLPETVEKRYALVDADGHISGTTIDIPKDSHIVSITYITDSGDTHYQNLEYKYVTDSGTTSTTYVDMSELVLETEFGSGVTVTNHVAHGVVDSTSEKDSNNNSFLTVGADGFKVDGIKAEIAAASGAVNTKVEELSAKTVTEVGSSNSSISATLSAATDGTKHLDVITDASKIKMSGYTSVASGVVSGSQPVVEAVAALEGAFIDNEQVVAAALNDLEAKKIENIVVNGVTGTFNNKVASVTIDGNDVVLGADYTKPAQGSAIATGDTVDEALGKLEAKVDAAVASGVQSVVSGTSISVNSTDSQHPIVNLNLKANAGDGDNDWHNPLQVDGATNSLYFDSIDAGTY